MGIRQVVSPTSRSPSRTRWPTGCSQSSRRSADGKRRSRLPRRRWNALRTKRSTIIGVAGYGNSPRTPCDLSREPSVLEGFRRASRRDSASSPRGLIVCFGTIPSTRACDSKKCMRSARFIRCASRASPVRLVFWPGTRSCGSGATPTPSTGSYSTVFESNAVERLARGVLRSDWRVKMGRGGCNVRVRAFR